MVTEQIELLVEYVRLINLFEYYRKVKEAVTLFVFSLDLCKTDIS